MIVALLVFVIPVGLVILAVAFRLTANTVMDWQDHRRKINDL